MLVDPEIAACFLEEANDSLIEWEGVCLKLEREAAPELYDALFRCAHNLKGSSRAVGFTEFGDFLHYVEDVINLLRKGSATLTPDLLSILFSVQSTLQSWLNGMRENPSYVENVEPIRAKLAPYHEGSALLPPESRTSSAAQREATQTQPDELEELFQAAQRDYQAREASKESPSEIGESHEETTTLETSLQERGKAPAEDKADTARVEETIRVSTRKLDELIQLIGELSVHQSMLGEAALRESASGAEFGRSLSLSIKTGKELCARALSLRMQSVHGLFQRLERVARDVARNQGKKIDVVVVGSEVELDKTIIERVTDPLIHIVRNAVDHGLETRDIRIAQGKSESGLLTISAVPDAGGVCIRIRDDGRGIDPERVFAKAVARSLAAPDATPSRSEIFQMLFLPGFSTAEQVTEISGRGVGLDVVLRSVQALRGDISIDSELGKGACFTITLPSSLSIVDALVVEVAGERCLVPLSDLTEIISLRDHEIQMNGPHGRMISFRDKAVAVEPLHRHLPHSARPAGDELDNGQLRRSPALLVREGGHSVAFAVDGVIGQQQVVVKPAGAHLKALDEISGCTVLGNGEPSLILNLALLARRWLSSLHEQEQRL